MRAPRRAALAGFLALALGAGSASPSLAGPARRPRAGDPLALVGELRPYRAALHVHTTFSTGELTHEEVVSKAKAAGIEIVAFTDHELIRMAWGPPPFRNLFSYGMDYRPSVLAIGVDTYFNTIEKLQRENPTMILIPGIETAPFYYVSGNPILGELTIHDWRRHILILGMGREAVKRLPVPNNGLSSRYFSVLLPGWLFFVGAAFFSLLLLIYRGWIRWLGVAMLLVSLLGAIDAHPFKSSPFSSYLGDQGARPYQEIINYAEENGGFALWAHQGSLLAEQKTGRATLKTPPHARMLLETVNFWGFDAIYEDNFTESNPGQEWDKYLVGYVNGMRPRPVWAYGGVDFHSESELGGKKRLTDIQNVFLMDEASEDAFFRALVNGRFYVVRGYTPARLQMDYFRVTSPDRRATGTYGADLQFEGPPRVEFQVSAQDGSSVSVKAELIRMGRVIRTFEGATPFKVEFTDQDSIPFNRFYYRLDVKVSRSEHIVTNPVFIRR